MSMKNLIYENKVPSTKHKHVGIELELLIPYGSKSRVVEDLLKADLQWNVTVGDDGSIKDLDFVPIAGIRRSQWDDEPIIKNYRDQWDGIEVRILAEEMEAPGVINKVCEVLKKHKAKVNKTCGLHVHLDLRHRDFDLVFKNFMAIQGILFKTQPQSRRNNKYCKRLTKAESDPILRHSVREGRRYAINRQAFDKYRTLEIRIHEGTVDATEIKLWTAFLIYIANMNKSLDKDVHNPVNLNIPDVLKGHLNARIKKYAGE